MGTEKHLRNGWEALRRGDHLLAQAHAEAAQQIAPDHPGVRMLVHRLSSASPERNEFGRIRVAIVMFLVEIASIGVLCDALHKIQVEGTTTFMDFGGKSQPAWQVASAAGLAIFCVPPVAWILWKAMK